MFILNFILKSQKACMSKDKKIRKEIFKWQYKNSGLFSQHESRRGDLDINPLTWHSKEMSENITLHGEVISQVEISVFSS